MDEQELPGDRPAPSGDGRQHQLLRWGSARRRLLRTDPRRGIRANGLLLNERRALVSLHVAGATRRLADEPLQDDTVFAVDVSREWSEPKEMKTT
jgi:hypothetical protein